MFHSAGDDWPTALAADMVARGPEYWWPHWKRSTVPYDVLYLAAMYRPDPDSVECRLCGVRTETTFAAPEPDHGRIYVQATGDFMPCPVFAFAVGRAIEKIGDRSA